MAVWTTAVKTWAAGNRLTGVLLNAQLRDFANAFGPRGSYTPLFSGTGFVLGNGTVSGVYSQVQNEVRGNATVNIGTTTTPGTGAYALTLPTAASNFQLGRPIGLMTILVSGTITAVRTAVLVSSTQIGFVDTGGSRVKYNDPVTITYGAGTWYAVIEFDYEAA